MTDIDTLGLTLYGEARGEPIEGKIAVASVIRNRLLTNRWGKSYQAVCLAKQQFSCWNPGDPNQKYLTAMAEEIAKGNRPNDPTWIECQWIADGTFYYKFRSNVSDATHYYAKTMTSPPVWALGAREVAVVGQHLFFDKVK